MSTTGNTTLVRMDMSRTNEYLKPEYYKPKLNFFQKAGRFLGKALSVLGPIAAAVTSVAVPGIGLPLAAGIYGVSNLAGGLTARAEAKDAANVSSEYARMSQMPVAMPGFFEQASQADIQTNFITPQSMVPPTIDTIVNREYASHSAVENFKF